jgi:cell division septal protein FtsQ
VKRFARAFVLAISLASIAAAACGIYCAARSPLFTVRVVEVSGAGSSELDASLAQSVTDLAQVPVGKANLFDLDLGQIENRVLSNAWIRSVRVKKSFPQTLAIEVDLKTPQAIFQSLGGGLSYIDTDGRPFGKVSLASLRDLPLLSGFDREPRTRVQQALRLLGDWQLSKASDSARLTSLSWEGERGFRGLVVYGLKQGRAHAMVDFGQEVDADPIPQLKRLSEVLHYLSENSIPARQIWADSGKKIVVKTAHGS